MLSAKVELNQTKRRSTERRSRRREIQQLPRSRNAVRTYNINHEVDRCGPCFIIDRDRVEVPSSSSEDINSHPRGD